MRLLARGRPWSLAASEVLYEMACQGFCKSTSRLEFHTVVALIVNSRHLKNPQRARRWSNNFYKVHSSGWTALQQDPSNCAQSAFQVVAWDNSSSVRSLTGRIRSLRHSREGGSPRLMKGHAMRWVARRTASCGWRCFCSPRAALSSPKRLFCLKALRHPRTLQLLESLQ